MSDSEDFSDDQGDQEWDDWAEESSSATRDILYHEKEHESTTACLQHCKDTYGWDLLGLAKELRLDIYNSIRFVNWMRKEVASKRANLKDEELISHMKGVFASGKPKFLDEDDDLLFPYLPDDPLLSALSTDFGEENEEITVSAQAPKPSEKVPTQEAVVESLREENARLRNQLSSQMALIEAAKLSILGSEDAEDEEEPEKASGLAEGPGAEESRLKPSEKSYFDGYATFGIHYDMLSDTVRTESYRDFLINNPSLIKDKVVLDVGCGTGILSMFAASAGAKQVIGVDMSDIVADAQEIIKANGLSDKITIIRGKIEEIKLPVEKVDLIVSEWMGYFLMYESMLDSVLWARDRYLAPGGTVMPDIHTMHIAMLDDSERLKFWDKVYGFDMTHIKRRIRNRGGTEATVDHYEKKQIISNTALLATFDCRSVTVKELEYKSPFSLVADREGQCDALCTHFDSLFQNGCDKPVTSLSTGPYGDPSQQTHWKQTVFYLDGAPTVKAGDVVEGTLSSVRHHKNQRHLEVVIEWSFVPKDGPRSEVKYQKFEIV